MDIQRCQNHGTCETFGTLLEFNHIGSIFTATIPFVAEEFRSISMRCWQIWHWKKATKGSLKPSNYGFDPIRPRNVMANCLTEFSRVWAYNPLIGGKPWRPLIQQSHRSL